MRKCTDWLLSYLEYTEMLEAPEIFHFWTGVSTLAAALRRKVWIDQIHFKWSPNFYIIFVAPPGIAQKTTTIDVGYQLLKEVGDIYIGPDDITWQAMISDLAEACQYYTIEGQQVPQCCATYSIGELGSFLDTQDKAQVDRLTTLWDCRLRGYIKKTKTQSTDVIHDYFLNLIGATTPKWLTQNIPDYMIGGGLTSRILFIHGHKKRHLTANLKSRVQLDSFKRLQQDLLFDLKEISNLCGEFVFSPEALSWQEEWYKNLWHSGNKNFQTEHMAGYRARKQTHLTKLAMVISSARSNSMEISDQILIEANNILTAMEPAMTNTFRSFSPPSGRPASSNGAIEKILFMIQQSNGLPPSILWRNVIGHFKNVHEFNQLLNGMIGAELIKKIQDPQTHQILICPMEDKVNEHH